MITRGMLETALKNSNTEITAEHKMRMDMVYGNIPFSMPTKREWDMDAKEMPYIPPEYPGSDKILEILEPYWEEMKDED